ncbi:MAG TPA: hypothetical protein VFX49_20980, partial [Chloroflexota bacterium]|nr:hypothetical protein [Chloroflexota bacterium]
YQNDAGSFYLLLDLTGDMQDDPIGGAGMPDYFDVTFDANRDVSVTPNVDLNYGLVSWPGSTGAGLCVQRYIGPGVFTGCQVPQSTLGAGFGASLDSSTPHRVWEFRFLLSEVGSAPGEIVRLGVETTSQNPAFSDRVPQNLYGDMTGLAEIQLATGPAPAAWPAGSTLTASGVTATTLTLNWTPAQNAASYRLYRGAALVASPLGPVTTLAVTGLTAGTAYTFKVEACDLAGTCTTTGPSVSVTTPIEVSGVAACGGTILAGATIELLSGSVVVATAVAGPTGAYSFTGIAAGATYSVRYRLTADGVPLSCGATFVADPSGSTTVPAAPLCRDRNNRTWLSAAPLGSGGAVSDYLCRAGQSAWYRISVRPGQQVVVTLRDLPADYDLALYRDLAALAASLETDTLDEVRLLDASTSGARAAPIDSAPIDSAPIDSAPIDSAPIDSAPIDSAPIDSAPIDSAPIDSAPIDSAPIDSAPIDNAPIDSAPIDSAPIDSAPIDSAPIDSAAYTSVQLAGLLALSARTGTATEVVLRNTWDHDGEFYVRVFGSNGAYNAGAPFTLEARVETLACAGVTLAKTPPSGQPTGTPRTLILTNTDRLGLSAADAAAFLSRLGTFASRVGGVVADLKDDSGIRDNYARWDTPGAQACAAAANVVAESIHDLIARYRAPNPAALEYVVLAGGDSVIPFLRLPDQASLASEKSYDPPVRDSTASQASLRQGYVLSQDYYGSFSPITRFDHTLYLPEVAVGRLVETRADIEAMLNAYDAASGALRPATGLSTGYGFLADLADHVAQQLTQSGLTVQSLVERRAVTSDAWTADDLRARLFGGPRSDVVALNAHFSANQLLAANYASTLSSTEIYARTDGRLRNTLILSSGCHVAYNIVNGHAVPNLTQPIDFAQSFNHQGATLIGGTGYQYGDTEYLLYSEQLLAGVLRELRYGSGPVPIGKALASAKRAYLAELAVLSGVDEKAMGELTLYGLPMLGIDLPTGRLTRPSPPTVSPVPLGAGLAVADVTPSYALDQHSVTLQSLDGGTTAQASYFAADGSVQAIPYRPLLPRDLTSVAAPGTLARGAALLAADYTDLASFRPYVHVPSTEEPSIHPRYLSGVFAPIQPLALNVLSGESLVVMPFQYRSDGAAAVGTGRRYDALTARVYYSSATGSRALAGPPSIARTRAGANGQRVLVDVTAGGPTAAGIEDVLITYTAARPGSTVYGRWRSCSLIPGRAGGGGRTPSCVAATAGAPVTTGPHALAQYTGEIDTAGTGAAPGDVRFFVQVVGGTGLVSTATNNGQFYAAVTQTATIAAPKAATALALRAPGSAAYRSVIEVEATLTSGGAPIAGKLVVFSLGSARVGATTGPGGVALARLPVDVFPRSAVYQVTASFAEDIGYLAAGASADLTVSAADTTLTPPGGAVSTEYSGSVVLARLDAGHARRVLDSQPVLISLGARTIAATTDA